MPVKDTGELGCIGRLIRLHHVQLFAFAITFLVVCLAFGCVVGVVVCTSSWSPAIFHPIFNSATILAKFGICVACASMFLLWVFAFAFSLLPS